MGQCRLAASFKGVKEVDQQKGSGDQAKLEQSTILYCLLSSTSNMRRLQPSCLKKAMSALVARGNQKI